jgi:hypothetical protein
MPAGDRMKRFMNSSSIKKHSASATNCGFDIERNSSPSRTASRSISAGVRGMKSAGSTSSYWALQMLAAMS